MNLKLLGGGTMEAHDAVFAQQYKEGLIHQSVTAFLAGARRGTKAQKSRSQKSGGGSKPWRQKGTGRARAGTIRSPLWRGGGCTFAAKPRNYRQKLNRKMYRAAMCSILSELIRRDCLLIVDEFSVAEPKTKLMVQKLDELGLTSALIVDAELSDEVILASRNLPDVGFLKAAELDPVNVLRFDKVLITVAAIKQLEERLQ